VTSDRWLVRERSIDQLNAVDDFVAVKASDFSKSQQLSTIDPQEVQYQ
jgi:hypothetical protein